MSDAERSYHGRPIVKEPAWTWEVPWYLFTGGLGGASAVMCAAASAAGNEELGRRARLLAGAAAGVSTPLLIADLGRPRRFINMLRVFKPTSVMSVGSWTLAAFSTVAGASSATALLDWFPRLRRLLDLIAGVLGLGMTTYTGALVADTSIPVWHGARRQLPVLFASSGLASAGAAATLVTSPEHAAPARRVAVIGAVGELATHEWMTRDLDEIGEVYEEGRAGTFHRLATAATAGGAVLIALGGTRRRSLTLLGSAAVLAGSICLRWSVYEAGFQSARDPRAVVGPQRTRLDRGDGHRGDPAPRPPIC